MASDILLKVGSIVLLLGGLIFVHELGHFVAAKLLGVKVVKFSIGFGPRLLGYRRGETEYVVSLLPLGGYVKMAGDEPGAEVAPEDRGRGFLEAPPWKRFVIAFAGPAANLAFPVVIYFALALAQNGSAVPGPTLGTVMPGSAADRAGLLAGDRVLAVAVPGKPPAPVRYFSDLRLAVAPRAGDRIEFSVDRGGQKLTIPVVPAAEKESNPVETVTRGVIGVSPAYPAAVVAPVLPGSAGPLAPFDLAGRALRPARPGGPARVAGGRARSGALHLRAAPDRSGSHLRRRPSRLRGRRPHRLDLHRRGHPGKPGRPGRPAARRRHRLRERQAGALLPGPEPALAGLPLRHAGEARPRRRPRDGAHARRPGIRRRDDPRDPHADLARLLPRAARARRVEGAGGRGGPALGRGRRGLLERHRPPRRGGAPHLARHRPHRPGRDQLQDRGRPDHALPDRRPGRAGGLGELPLQDGPHQREPGHHEPAPQPGA